MLRRSARAGLAVAFSALMALALSPSARAIETGVYICAVEHAVLVTAAGKSLPIENAPSEVVVNASATPHSADLGHDAPQRALDYYSEGGTAVSVTVGGQLFAAPTSAMRSEDGAVYVSGGNVIRFLGEGRFTATGYASISANGEGIAVYSGNCNKR